MNTSAAIVAEHTLLVATVVLCSGAVLGFLARKLRVPDIALFLLAGMLLGPQALGLINVPAESALNQVLLMFGAAYILFDGGAALRLQVVKQVWITIATIATLGVLITAGVTAVAAVKIAAVPWPVALLLGAVLASTDPATLIPIFKQIKIKERLAQTVVSESAVNDAVGAILTFTILAIVMGTGSWSLSSALLGLLQESAIGLSLGASIGYLACVFIASEKYGFLHEHVPLVTLIVVVGAYLGAGSLHSSGFMTVFAAGVVLGNKELFGFRLEAKEQEKLVEFIEITSMIMRMFIFILLGSQVDFALLGQYGGSAALIVTVFMLIARPLTVLICAVPDRRAAWTARELLFMCWTRETGVIPGALASMLLGLKAPGSEFIAAVTFAAILATILIQATTTRWLANRLGLLAPQGRRT
jgi:potassium/hydrogen antiporter